MKLGRIRRNKQMRLIDADKYLEKVCTYKETGCGSCKLQTMCPKDAPTVEAIPVEWLKAYFKKCLSFDDRVFIDNEDSNYDIVIDKYKIFEEWEKENETEESNRNI